ncbi:class I SAM-dependent methyltransferase [Actinophytocola oryzae]|uniref:Methyltransferase family protein n=1 Tax=Actinophytocola oryzae TaxID=502181 RepID=A0A4V3FSE0_9PSEU|nr:class I SAM-dependent methyltransferase [Actinophytocola oryzae]TDV47111.1 methyltransferase family protein [Actinophytocola oryzae]
MADWSRDEFDDLYASVGHDLDQVPWARLAPNATLVDWLDRRTIMPGSRALVVACGLGDDAEELAGRGCAVTAFDLSATAIGWCHRRFPASSVTYQTADLLRLPPEWARRYDLVVEINTIQSLPLELRDEAVRAIAGTIAEGGALFVRCFGRAPDEPADSRPWPVSRAELAVFEQEGLREAEFAEDFPEPNRHRCFRLTYERIF